MPRLNSRAFEILNAEIQRCSTNDIAGQVQQGIALKRLEKLRLQQGLPVTVVDLQETLSDLYPDFSQTVLQAAVRANRPPSRVWQRIKFATIAVAGIAGSLWVLNLPYPMIRIPVSRVAPILLLPSFMDMDYHYRQTIALVEQSDQLVNQATSAADFQLGAEKVHAAQKHLNALPVWFLGYYPQTYCRWFQCSWRFTLDEFQQARKQIARMEAKLFQETQAQTQLTQAEQDLGNAKQQYQEAPNPAEQSAAIAQWQQAIDTLGQISTQTLAGQIAQTKLAVYQRDFQKVVGFTIGNARSGNLMQAARASAEVAGELAQGPARSTTEWEEVQKHWSNAILQLEQIDVKDPDYARSRQLKATYEKNLSLARIRQQTEQESVQAYEQAQQLKERLLATVGAAKGEGIDASQLISQLQTIADTLKQVKPGTTVYPEAQELLGFAEKRLRQYEKGAGSRG